MKHILDQLEGCRPHAKEDGTIFIVTILHVSRQWEVCLYPSDTDEMLAALAMVLTRVVKVKTQRETK